MTILKSSDGKILTNLAGEVYKTPPLIDISSTYGVTKDGSNLVSSVKNRNNANKFRQSVGANQPTENGDGIDCVGGKWLEFPNINYLKAGMIEMWVKAPNGGALMAQRNSNTDYFQINLSAYMDLFIRANSVDYGGTLLAGITGLYPCQYGIKTHIFMYLDIPTGNISVYYDGFPTIALYNTNILVNNSKAKFTLGALNYGGVYSCGAKIYSFKMVNFLDDKFNNNNGANTAKVNYTNRLFTPPTYPNTLL